MRSFDELEIFHAIVRANSFTQAAKQLGLSKSHVSKKLTQLEERLGYKLIERHSRLLSLTRDGKVLFHATNQLLSHYDAVLDQHIATDEHLQGELRITTSGAALSQWLAPVISQFIQQHPDVNFDIIDDQHYLDLRKQNIDIAFRVAAHLPDSSYIAQKIGVINSKLYATPTYLKKQGNPSKLTDLKQHLCAIYSFYTHKNIHFNYRSKPIELSLTNTLTCNQSLVIRSFILQHHCIGMLPDFLATDKKLIEVLPDYKLPKRTLYTIYSSKEYLPKRARVFIAYVKAYYEG